MKTPALNSHDAALERRIDSAKRVFVHTCERRDYEYFVRLVKSRSPAAVASLESSRGLSALTVSNGQGGIPAGRFKPVQPVRPNTPA
jgi:hypothetical protein